MEEKKGMTKMEKFLFNRIVQLKNAPIDFKNKESTKNLINLNMTLYLRLTNNKWPTAELIEKLLPIFKQEIQ